jgi:hypothetical protein
MAVFDVREDVEESITEIVFAEKKDNEGTSLAYKMGRMWNGVALHDDTGEKVLVQSAQDAQSLIKALNKAIELGWLR